MKCVGKTDSTGFFLFQVILLTFRPLVSSHLKTQRCSRNGLREFLDCSVQLSSSICVCTQSGSVQHSSIHVLANIHMKIFKFSHKRLLLHLTSDLFSYLICYTNDITLYYRQLSVCSKLGLEDIGQNHSFHHGQILLEFV